MRPRHFLILPVLVLMTLVQVAGCQGTRSAYQAAAGPEETAKVVTEHYIAIVHELNALKASGDLAGAQLVQAQQLVASTKPLVDQLSIAAINFEAVRSAQSEADLSRALNQATIAVSRLIDLLRGVRPPA